MNSWCEIRGMNHDEDPVFPVIDFWKCGVTVEDDKDINLGDIEKVGKELYEVCSKHGFAYLSNTGITREVIEELNALSEEFYALPLDVKREFCTGSVEGGYDPYGALRVSQKRDVDYQEAFRVTGHYLEDAAIPWHKIPLLKKKTVEFMDMAKTLTLRILKLLGVAMKLKDSEEFCKNHRRMNCNGNDTCSKTIHYFPIIDEESMKDNQMRLAEHTDTATLTLVFQDKIGGLQAKNHEGKFVDVPPIPDTAIVIIGNILPYLCGDRLKALVHRVVPPTDPGRQKKLKQSVLYFAKPDNEALMECRKFQDDLPNKKDLRSSSVTVGEFLHKRFKQLFY